MQPWYLRATPLRIIARLVANPPELRREEGPFDNGPMEYAGFDALALRDQFRKEFAKFQSGPYDRAKGEALLNTSADEIMAALFGDPDGLDWADPDRTARRKAMAAQIVAALDVKVAA